MQEKEQRRQPDIEMMFSYPDSGPGEECCDLCGHVHQHGEAIARFSANAFFQICQDCFEHYMEDGGDVDDILEALTEIIEENVDGIRALRSLRPLRPGSRSCVS